MSVEANQPGRPRESLAWVDLGGREPIEPLTPEQEEILYGQGLGRRDFRIELGRRLRARAKREEDEARFSPTQRAISRAGLAAAREALLAVIDKDISPEELTHRTAVRIARGYERPQPVRQDPPAMTPQERAAIGFEQGAELHIPSPLPVDSNQPSLFDEPTQPDVAELKVSKPFVDVEAYEQIMKALSLYNQVGHAEDNIDGIAKKHDNPGAIIDGMKARADRAIREAYPYFDRLLDVWLLRQQGYTTEQIAEKRYEMIKEFKRFAAETTSNERREFIKQLKKTQEN